MSLIIFSIYAVFLGKSHRSCYEKVIDLAMKIENKEEINRLYSKILFFTFYVGKTFYGNLI